MHWHSYGPGVPDSHSCWLSYALDPTSLESRINYALYQHAVQHDYELARVLYQQALQDEDQRRHPLVHYSVALLLLADDSASAAQRGLRDVVEKVGKKIISGLLTMLLCLVYAFARRGCS